MKTLLLSLLATGTLFAGDVVVIYAPAPQPTPTLMDAILWREIVGKNAPYVPPSVPAPQQRPLMDYYLYQQMYRNNPPR